MLDEEEGWNPGNGYNNKKLYKNNYQVLTLSLIFYIFVVCKYKNIVGSEEMKSTISLHRIRLTVLPVWLIEIHRLWVCRTICSFICGFFTIKFCSLKIWQCGIAYESYLMPTSALHLYVHICIYAYSHKNSEFLPIDPFFFHLFFLLCEFIWSVTSSSQHYVLDLLSTSSISNSKSSMPKW